MDDRISPFHQIPILDDDGFIVAESGAILLHLEDVLTKLGLPVEAGAGLKAATEHLAKTK